MQVRRALIASVAALAFAGTANAAFIDLSTNSSEADEPGGTPAGVLLARFEFTITGTTLTLEVSNNTVAPNEYNINEIYFNGPAGISLTPVGLPSPWVFGTGVIGAGQFGIFDFGLFGPLDNNVTDVILPGMSKTFTFNISGGSPTEEDFITFLSETPPGDHPMIVSAKFVFGPDMDSAFGGTVPSPGSLALLAVAGVLLGRRKRRAA